MALSGGNSSFTGVYYNTGKIQKAVSVSNKSYDPISKGYVDGGDKPCDVGLVITVDVPGQTFTKDIKVSGNFNPNKPNEWSGSAYSVKIFLENMRLKNWALNDDNSIPDDVLEQLVGKEIGYLRYPGAKNGDKVTQYTYKNIVLSSYVYKKLNQTAEQFLRGKYDADVAAGYVKPLADEDTSFDTAGMDAGLVPEAHTEPTTY